jgi:hypothetical protein
MSALPGEDRQRRGGLGHLMEWTWPMAGLIAGEAPPEVSNLG